METNTEETEGLDMTAIAEAFSAIPIVTEQELRAWEWKNVIAPTLKSGGFDIRFMKEVTEWPELSQRRVYELCQKLAVGTGAIIALVGPRGTGKTTVAAQLAIDIAWKWTAYFDQPPSNRTERRPIGLAKYIKLVSLAGTLKPLYSDFGSVGTESLEHYRETICNCGLLIIDEKNDCEDMAVAGRILTDILDRRYANLKDSIIISNETARGFDRSTSDSVLSRIKEHGRVIECAWKSFR